MDLDQPKTTESTVEYEVQIDNYEISINNSVLQLGLIFNDIVPKDDLDYAFKSIGRSLESVLNSKFITVYF